MSICQIAPQSLKRSPYNSTNSSSSAYSFVTLNSSTVSHHSEKQTHFASNSPLQLNFVYQRHISSKKANEDEYDDVISSDDSSLSDREFSSLSPRSETFVEKLHFGREESFAKFLPLDISVRKSAHMMPKIMQNYKDKREWEEAQNAFLRRRANKQLFVRNSKSDTLVLEEKDTIDKTQNKRQKLKGFLSNLRNVSKNRKEKRGNPQSSVDILLNEEELAECLPPKLSDARFSNDLNYQFIRLNMKDRPDFSAVLYAQVPGAEHGCSTRPVNHGLCHMKTELVVSAMLNFFYPYSDVQCLWMTNLQDKLLQLLAQPHLKAKFSKLVYLRRFEAILVLSSDSSALLRHRNTCFLHSLAAALEIGSHRLLVLENVSCSASSPSSCTPSHSDHSTIVLS